MKIAILASNTNKAQSLKTHLDNTLPTVCVDRADVIVALGGDGFLIETLGTQPSKPVFGMNLGTVGFLMNSLNDDPLIKRIQQAVPQHIHPLVADVHILDGHVQTVEAINEISMLRGSAQAAHVQIDISGITRMDRLMGDGVLLATPTGSTAYNLSAGGPVLPLDANVLALTPIAAYRPRRWRGAIVSDHNNVTLKALDCEKRKVLLSADSLQIESVEKAVIRKSPNHHTLLFDPNRNLSERLHQEAFC